MAQALTERIGNTERPGVLEIPDHPDEVSGTIKWFDPVKGFGFILTDDGGPDVLLHVNVLRNFGQSSVADGVAVDVKVQRTNRGVQAVEILRLQPPVDALATPLADITEFTYGDVGQVPLEPGRVKWFDKGKGFGFANVFGSGEDVFVHVEVLRRSGLADLAPGEALAMRVIDGQRGRMAAEILPWEFAIPKSDDT